MSGPRWVKNVLNALPEPRNRAALDAARSLRSVVTGRVTQPAQSAAARSNGKGKQKKVVPLRQRIERAFESKDPERIARALGRMHALQRRVERLATPPAVPAGQRLSEHSGVQSTQFMIDMLPDIQAIIARYPRGHRFTVLDVGPGTGAGTELLATLYSSRRLGYLMDVSALDITAVWRNYLWAFAPRVRFVHGDVFKHEERYDLVIASHVIEHVKDPVGFARQLQQLARVAVVVAAPFNEPPDRLVAGHFHSIDEQRIAEMEPRSYRLMHSPTWGAQHDPPYQMFIAELPGLADQEAGEVAVEPVDVAVSADR